MTKINVPTNPQIAALYDTYKAHTGMQHESAAAVLVLAHIIKEAVLHVFQQLKPDFKKDPSGKETK